MNRSRQAVEPSFLALFTPKLVTLLRAGYTRADLRADALAGLTVSIVALPLSMAIAIGCGLSPDRGLYSAIIGGFLISALGGSRYQVGGPAGAFIVLISTIIAKAGYDGLVLATLLASVLMMALGFLRLGTYIKYIPAPVTVGFTAGIAVIILASQLKELLGLEIAVEPAALLSKLTVLWSHRASINLSALTLAVVSIAAILSLRRLRPKWPGLLLVVIVSASLTALLHLEVATVGSRFGAVAGTIPPPYWPAASLMQVRAALPDAVAIALLGSIESLLSAVVADGMTGRRHRSNGELVAQGIANVAAVSFGGMCVTGAVARTATNIRAGARSPVAGMLHALYILAFLLIAAPLARYIPLACLGAVLAVVAWNMAEKEEFVSLLRSSWGDASVLLSTFLLTIFEDLTTAIGVGVTLGAFLFLHRMAESIRIETDQALLAGDIADMTGTARSFYAQKLPRDVIVYRMSGAYFFGATATVSSVLDGIGAQPRLFVLDFSEVTLVDVTAARALAGFVHKLSRAGTQVFLTGTRRGIRRPLLMAGLRKPVVRYARTADEAIRVGSP